MNRFDRLFSQAHPRAFLPFFTLGDPNPEASLALIKAAIDAGADALELGIPFSDPIADGPTNQRSMERALKSGMTFDKALAMIAGIRAYAPDIPMGLLLYYNLLYRRGIAKAHRDLAQAGIDAIVSADLPIEESTAHEASLQTQGIGAIQMIAPNTKNDRAQTLFQRSSAFTYVVSGFGPTGVRHEVDPRTLARVKHLRTLSDKPMVVGFGISQPEHVHMIHQAGAHGAIVGSKFSQVIEENLQDLTKAQQWIQQFIQAVKQV